MKTLSTRTILLFGQLVLVCSLAGCESSKGQPRDGGQEGLQLTDAQKLDAPPPDSPVPRDLPPLDLPPDLPPPDLPPDLPPPDLCVPDCSGRHCGGDGCGGECKPGCSASELCVTGQCVDKKIEISVAGTPELVWEYSASTFCAYPDGPVRMFREASGRAVALLSNVNSYRIESSSTDGEFTPTAAAPKLAYLSPQNKAESAFNALFWVSSVWTDDGAVVYALAQHQWFHTSLFVVSQGCVVGSAAINGQVSGIHHLTSGATGVTFKTTHAYNPLATSNADRLVLAPEFWGSKPVFPSGEVRYGFSRPSNIVKDGPFYYVVVATEELVRVTPKGNDYVIPYRVGFVMLRTTDITGGWANNGWDLWSGSAWQSINGKVDNGGAHIFTHSTIHPQPQTVVGFGDPQLQGRIDTMSYSLTFNNVASRWVLLGHTGNAQYVAYTSSATLSNPQWTEIRPVGGSENLTISDWSEAFPSLIDHSSAGKVFMYAGANPMLYYVRRNTSSDRDIYRVRLSITVK